MMDAQKAYDYVREEFPGFGVNKSYAVARLLYEVSKKNSIDIKSVLPEGIISTKDFFQAKSFLLGLRYPSLDQNELAQIPPLTKMNFSESAQVDLSKNDRRPKIVFFEGSVADSSLLKRLKQKLPGVPFEEIKKYSDYVKSHEFSIAEYNRRFEMLFVIREEFDIFLHCPCSKLSRPCGYHIMNAGMGCGFDCVYCYLQGYTNSPGIVVPGNLEDMFEKFSNYYCPGMRLGTGQFTDSLIMDDLTGFAPKIINFFRQYPDVMFEFKTKSNCIENILATPSAENILISWSLNPQKVIDSSEYLTASLDDRFKAAEQCTQAGYYAGFHFDPIVYYEGWEKDYQEVVDGIFQHVNSENIAWISLGCLRMTGKVRQVMEKRFPDSELLLAEQISGFDGKLRYPRRIRKRIYEVMLDSIFKHTNDTCVYLCMEDEEMNRDLKIPTVGPRTH